jgi:predicted amidohydrolase YtcJ
MPTADRVIFGTVLTVDDLAPTAEALAVSDGRIVAVGNRSTVEKWIGPETQKLDIGDGCVMPGLVEAHGHPLMEAIVLSDRMVGIRPVTMRSTADVVAAIRAEILKRGADGAYHMAGIRCWRKAFRSRRWPGSTAKPPIPRS